MKALKREALGADPKVRGQGGSSNQLMHGHYHSPINPIFYNSSAKPYSATFPNRNSTTTKNILDIENGQNLKKVQQVSHGNSSDIITFHEWKKSNEVRY